MGAVFQFTSPRSPVPARWLAAARPRIEPGLGSFLLASRVLWSHDVRLVHKHVALPSSKRIWGTPLRWGRFPDLMTRWMGVNVRHFERFRV